MQFEFRGARRFGGALMLVLLGACSSSDDGATSRQLQLSAQSLNFVAASPTAAAPAAQTITATFGAGVANISALQSGTAIEDVQVAINGTSAQITVVPAAPTTIGAGQFKSTIALTTYFCGDPACTRLEAGESSTVNVTYQVSPLVTDIAPSIAISGTSGSAIVRGTGFQAFALQGVNFNGTPATEFTLPSNSDSQINVVYPALTAGSYVVGLDASTHSGTIASNATLTVVDPVTRSAEALAWPAPVTTVHSLEYDTRHHALLIVTDANGGQLVRYPYSGGAWQTPLTAALANARDATLSLDGSRWLALSTTAVTPVDPVTLAPGTAIEVPSLPENAFAKTIALMHSNIAVITTGIAQSATTPLYWYSTLENEIVPTGATLNNATARAAGNSSTVAIMQGDPSLTAAPVLWVADAMTRQLTNTVIALNQNAIPPAFDRDATRLVLNGTNVYDKSYALLGKLPETTAAVVLRPDGKRAYTYDTAAGGLLVFDISATNEGEAYTALGAAIPLIAAPGAGAKMAISADANTLFVAGATQVVVQPTPAL